jgi:diguanylate cyclase (GGDEF)-like protein
MSDSTKSSRTGNFSAYSELITGLLTGVSAVAFFRPNGRCQWISEKSAGLKLKLAASETLRTGRSNRHLDSDEFVTFALPLRSRHEILGVLALTLSQADSDTWDMTVDRVEATLKPVITVLTNELGARPPEPKSKVLTERTEELEWLFSITSELRSGSSDTAVEQLLEAAVERIEASYGGLAIPEKRLNLTFASPSRGSPGAAVAYQQTHPHLMNLIQRQRKPLILNKPPAGADGAHHQKILALPVTSQHGKITGFIAFFKGAADPDFGRRAQYLGRHIARQIGALLDSQYDLATGLLTRVAFEERARQQLESCTETTHSVVYVDIDQLHVVNEQFGYEAGDELIVRIADLLRAPLLPSDAIAARASGDRFLIFLPGQDSTQAYDCAVGLQKAIGEFSLGSSGKPMSCSLSCGVSRLLRGEQPVSRAIAAAELACKTAKERGRNRCEVYLDVDASMMRRRSDITGLGMLKDALANDRLVLFAQKIVSIRDPHKVTGIECVARIATEDGRILAPAEFMPVAQRYKLLKQVDTWVIRKALSVLSPFAGMLLHSSMLVSINISGQSLSDKTLLSDIVSWIRASKVPPGRLMFELNETVAVSNLAPAEQLMRGLQKMGCRFALDDFGTGLNSLSYLKNLPVQCVKIDGSFVRDLATNPRSAAMIGAMVQLADALKIDCIGDFVESEAIFRALRELGVEQVQGAYIHQPERLERYLEACGDAESERIRNSMLE